jgi:hypothetical protein
VRAVISLLRGYASAAVLGIAAVVLLVLGAPARAALAGVGFAFIGAALTRAVDIARERRAAEEAATAARRRDLDETRRLAYAMLATRPSQRDGMLLATLINALVHHGAGVSRHDAEMHLSLVAAGSPSWHESTLWLEAQIDRITAELGS